MRKLLIAVIVLVLVALGIFLSLPTIVDRRMNVVELAPPYNASERARALHDKLFIADMHDDALLWSRDLLKRYAYSHTDLPRLQARRVGLQVFSAVTKTPKNINLERALYQSETRHKVAAGSGEKLRIVRTQADLAELLKTQTPVNGLLAAILSTEGLHPLEGKLENVDRLFDAGFRITGLTHLTDNEVGGLGPWPGERRRHCRSVFPLCSVRPERH